MLAFVGCFKSITARVKASIPFLVPALDPHTVFRHLVHAL